MPAPTLVTIQRGVLLFWALWFGVVAVTNVLDAGKALGWVPNRFAFTSGNWTWMESVMVPLHVPLGLQVFLFAGVILWETLCAVLFARAFAAFRGRSIEDETATKWALLVALALWAMFQLLDEVFLAFSPEAVHRVIFGNLLLTTLVLVYRPSRPESVS
jgi:hypothetical protein